MQTLLAGLFSLAKPILGRVLLSLGLSVVTVAGVSAAVQAVKGRVLSALAGAPADALAIFTLAGGYEGLGMVLGSVAFALAYWTATKAVRLAGSAAS